MTSIEISYDTSRNAKSPGAYRIGISDTDDAPTERLVQRAEVFNGIARYSGVFADRAAGVAAALAYIGGNNVVVEITDVLTGEVRHTVGHPSKLYETAPGVARRVIS